MDDQLRSELDALRKEKAERMQQHSDEVQLGRERLRQFVGEMKSHGIDPIPLVARVETTVEVPGTPGGLLRRGTPSTRRQVIQLKRIATGWPVGWKNSSDSLAPYGHRGDPLLTEDGKFHHFYWQEYRPNPDDVRGTPSRSDTVTVQSLTRPPDWPQWYLVTYDKELAEPNYSFHGGASHVAELLHHYIDGPQHTIG